MLHRRARTVYRAHAVPEAYAANSGAAIIGRQRGVSDPHADHGTTNRNPRSKKSRTRVATRFPVRT